MDAVANPSHHPQSPTAYATRATPSAEAATRTRNPLTPAGHRVGRTLLRHIGPREPAKARDRRQDAVFAWRYRARGLRAGNRLGRRHAGVPREAGVQVWVRQYGPFPVIVPSAVSFRSDCSLRDAPNPRHDECDPQPVETDRQERERNPEKEFVQLGIRDGPDNHLV